MDQIILLGTTQINCSDIKNCGIVTLELPYEMRYQRVPCDMLSHLAYEYKWTGDLVPVDVTGQHSLDDDALQENIYRRYHNISHNPVEIDLPTDKKGSYFIKKTDCLFLTTNQDQTIIFSALSAEFDIYEKLKEIHTFMIEAEP